MALVLADRVRDTTTTTGTGTVTLSGTAPNGYQTFGTAIGDANTTYYTIAAGTEWEVGVGTYTSSGTTLARTTVLSSSNSGAAVNFSAGTKDVFVTYPALVANPIGSKSVSLTGTAIDLTAGGYFYKTISGNTTLTITNAPSSGTEAAFRLRLTGAGAYTMTWPTGTRWSDSNTAPAFACSVPDTVLFSTIDGGTTWDASPYQMRLGASNYFITQLPAMIAYNFGSASTSIYAPGSDAATGDIATLAKFTTQGVLSFVKTVSDPDYGSGGNLVSALVDGSGDVFLTGYAYGPTTEASYLAKVSSAGVFSWGRHFHYSDTAYPYAAATDGTNAIIAVNRAGDDVIIKYNGSGTYQWEKPFSDPAGIYCLAADSSGNSYFAAALTAGPVALAKLDSSGTTTWARKLGVTMSGLAVAVDGSGNVAMGFVDSVAPNSNTGFGVALYNSSGTIQWQRYITVTGSLAFNYVSVLFDSGGNVYGVGSEEGAGGNRSKIVVKLNSSGTTQWSRRISGTTLTGVSGNAGITAADNLIIPIKSTTTSIANNFMTMSSGGDYIVDTPVERPFDIISVDVTDGSTNGVTVATSTYTDASATLTAGTATSTRANVTLTLTDVTASYSTEVTYI
jgi:hypothetical protein